MIRADVIRELAGVRPLVNLAYLEQGRNAWVWEVRQCVACGLRHIHGGGLLSEDPRRSLGHRAAHCLSGRCDCGYEIIDGDSRRTLALMHASRN